MNFLVSTFGNTVTHFGTGTHRDNSDTQGNTVTSGDTQGNTVTYRDTQ